MCAALAIDPATLHLTIRRGAVADSGQTLELWRSTMDPDAWQAVKVVLRRLEALCSSYTLGTVSVLACRVRELAQSRPAGGFFSRGELLQACRDADSLLAMMALPGRRFKAADGNEAAAVAMQTRYRYDFMSGSPPTTTTCSSSSAATSAAAAATCPFAPQFLSLLVGLATQSTLSSVYAALQWPRSTWNPSRQCVGLSASSPCAGREFRRGFTGVLVREGLVFVRYRWAPSYRHQRGLSRSSPVLIRYLALDAGLS